MWPRTLAFLLLAASAVRWIRFPESGEMKLVVGGVAVVYLSSIYGGWRYEGQLGKQILLAAQGFLGIFGFAVLISTLMKPEWHRLIKRFGLGLLILLLGASFIVFLLPVESSLPMGPPNIYFNASRISLIWPLRILTEQIVWEHTNFAGFIFAVALVVILEFLSRRSSVRSWPWWLLVLFLATAVFLSASRSAMVMVALALPMIAIRRGWPLLLKIAATFILAVGLGTVCLKINHAKFNTERSSTPSDLPAPPEQDLHGTGLIQRGSSGRTHIYEVLWNDLKGSRTFGQGLGITGTAVAHVNHEHSSYLATLRGGGFIAVAGHFMILGTSLWSAFRLYQKNIRWPLVLLTAVLAGLLFDHRSVFKMSGRHDFISHWTAVLLPLLITLRSTKALTMPSAPAPRSGSASEISR